MAGGLCGECGVAALVGDEAGVGAGFDDVAVVDKDDPKRPPFFLTWGAPPVVFKGFDAGSLGELILIDKP